MSSDKSQTRIPLAEPKISGNEWTYVKECLDTGYVSSVGSFVDRFEQELASRVQAKYAVATVNGTAALHVALLVAGVQHDDEVLVPTLTFIAPVNAIRYAGAWPVFIDADPVYWQMDVNKVEEFLAEECSFKKGELRNKKTGRRVKALLPVHILGHPVDMDPLLELARKYALVVIEDATESLGAMYKNKPVGHLGDIACFSFNGNKIITTGGGGMIVTDNESWAQRAKYLTTQAKDDPIEYIHHEVGYNYRLTNLQAAMGCAQLEQLDAYVAAKRRIAMTYREGLRDVSGLHFMQEAAWAKSIYWMFTVRIEASFGATRQSVHEAMQAQHIQTRPLWQPIHRNKPYEAGLTLPVAETLYRECLSLPCSVGLQAADQQRVVETLRRIVAH